MSYAESYYFSGNRLRDLLFLSPTKFLGSSHAAAMNTGQSHVKQPDPEHAPSSPSPKRKRTSAGASQLDSSTASELIPETATATGTCTTQDTAHNRNGKTPHSTDLVGPSQTRHVTNFSGNAASKHNERFRTEIDSPKADSGVHRKAPQVTVSHTPPSQGRPAKKRRLDVLKNLTAADILGMVPPRKADAKGSPGGLKQYSGQENPHPKRHLVQVSVPSTPSRSEKTPKATVHNGQEGQSMGPKRLVQVVVPRTSPRSEKSPETIPHNEQEEYFVRPKPLIQVVVPRTPSHAEKAPRVTVPNAHSEQKGNSMASKRQGDQISTELAVARLSSCSGNESNAKNSRSPPPEITQHKTDHAEDVRQSLEKLSPTEKLQLENEASTFGSNNSRSPPPEIAQHKTHRAEDVRESLEGLLPTEKPKLQGDASKFAQTNFLERPHEHQDYLPHIEAPRISSPHSTRQFRPSPEKISQHIPPHPNQNPWSEQKVPEHQNSAQRLDRDSKQHLPISILQPTNPPVSNTLVSAPPVPPQSHTYLPSSFYPKIPSYKSYLKHEPDVVKPINKDNAEKRARYEPATIVSDILIACGRHPTEPPLNYHLLPLRDAFSFVGFDSDLATFRWDWVDAVPIPGEHITRSEQPSG